MCSGYLEFAGVIERYVLEGELIKCDSWFACASCLTSAYDLTFAYKFAGRAFLRVQSRGQHLVEASQAHSVGVLASVLSDLHSAGNAQNSARRISSRRFFDHTSAPPGNLRASVSPVSYRRVTKRLIKS